MNLIEENVLYHHNRNQSLKDNLSQWSEIKELFAEATKGRSQLNGRTEIAGVCANLLLQIRSNHHENWERFKLEESTLYQELLVEQVKVFVL